MNDRKHDPLRNIDNNAGLYDFDRTGTDDDYDTEDTEDTDAFDEIDVIEEVDFEDIDLEDIDDEDLDEFEDFGDDGEDEDDDGCDCGCDTTDDSSPRKPMISLPPDLVIRLLLLALAAVSGSQTVAWLHPAVEQMCDELDDLYHLFH